MEYTIIINFKFNLQHISLIQCEYYLELMIMNKYIFVSTQNMYFYKKHTFSLKRTYSKTPETDCGKLTALRERRFETWSRPIDHVCGSVFVNLPFPKHLGASSFPWTALVLFSSFNAFCILIIFQEHITDHK